MAKRTEVVEKVEVVDDLDGTPLDPDTRAVKYVFNSGVYNLYLSAANRKKVDKFIKDLTDGAEKARTQKGRTAGKAAISGAEKKARLAAYNKATGDKKERYSKTVQQWWRDNH